MQKTNARRLFPALAACLLLCAGLFGCSAQTAGGSNPVVSSAGSTKPCASAPQAPAGPSSFVQPAPAGWEIGHLFGDASGCAVLYAPASGQYSLYQPQMCETRFSPYSTFKIISACMGLHNSVLESEDSRMHYSGAQYPVPAWNADLSLKEAFQSSCVWYFRQVIDTLGEERVAQELKALSYGNCDISQWEGSGINPLPDMNGFWLGASLKVSPIEQVQALAQIFSGAGIYTAQETAVVKDMMLAGEAESWRLYGKTGTGPAGEAWFTGFVQNGSQSLYFAFFLNSSASGQAPSGDTAKEIAFRALSDAVGVQFQPCEA